MTDVAAAASEPWIPKDTFADRLAAIRRQKKLTQLEAARACALDDGSWSNWERGGNPRNMADVVERIAMALNVDRDWLMWGGPRSRCVPVYAGQEQGELITHDGVGWNDSGVLCAVH